MNNEREPLLKVEDLCMYFKGSSSKLTKAVDGVSFEVYPGETYGLVGESGSGKSTIGRCVIRLYKPTGGKILYNNLDISGKLTKEENGVLRKGIQMIFQDPMASLNPSKSIGDIVGEGLDISHNYSSREERHAKIIEMLHLVGINPQFYERFPFHLSGGQRQRVGIARALVMNPDLIIADECISALDVSIQAQVVNILKDVQKKMGTAMIFIAHDLSMVKYISDRIGVLHLGHLVETGTTEEIFANPVHPYTQSLISTIPSTYPIMEKMKKTVSYDYKTSGLDYSKGKMKLVEGSHYVLTE